MPNWKTKEGKEVDIAEMSNDRLLNTIKMLVRVGESKRIEHCANYLKGHYPNGDMAEMAFDAEIDRAFAKTWQDFVPEIMGDLLHEYAERGVDVTPLSEYIDGVTRGGLYVELARLAAFMSKPNETIKEQAKKAPDIT